MKKIAQAFLVFFALTTVNLSAQIRADKLSEWEGRKYSMFIHWGIYSQLGGVWQNKQISYGLSEQIQSHAGIYSDVYANVAESFNPEKWNADEVVLLAKKAGMKSIVFTSKHHDGFCMFKTSTTRFNIVDATPYKRDVLKELSEACARHGIKFALYYSLIDWHFPQASPISSHNSDIITPEHFEFNKRQVEELLSNYGEIAELWFDMGSHNLQQSVEMKAWVYKFQPNCMVGGRIGNGQGDFMVMGDNQEPDYILGTPWQSPASFFDETWGYRSWQNRTDADEKYKEKLTSLINVCARGGNFLLNIGPRGDGSVVEYEKDILFRIGRWLEKNGEAIYDTTADPFHKVFEWGAVTAKANNIYLHILNMPQDGRIVLPSVMGDIKSVTILGENIKCKSARTYEGLVVSIPQTVNANDVVVVNISFKGRYSVAPLNILNYVRDLKLNQNNAFNYYSNSGVDYNSMYQSTVKNEWTLLTPASEGVVPVLTYTKQEVGKILNLKLNDGEQKVALNDVDAEITELNNEGVVWGDIHIQELRRSSLMRIHDDIKNIDVSKTWGGKEWKKTNYTNNETYTLPGGLLHTYYLTQEIISPKDQTVLVFVASGDGIVVALNGDVLVNHDNLEQSLAIHDIVALDLKKGKNTLFVKLFSNFEDEILFSIDNSIPQQVYTKKLPYVQFKANQYFPVSWTVDNPISIHETMNVPNLNLEFRAK